MHIVRAAILFVVLLALEAHAQVPAYSLNWNTLSSGIGPVTGGAYQVRGSLGQPDAGRLAAGTYTVEGGFWVPGAMGTVGIEPPVDPVPLVFSASVPEPNPSRALTAFAFELPAPRLARVTIFGVNGKRVRLLLNEERGVGRHRVLWDGTDDDGRRAPAGIYFAHIKAGEFSASHRVVRLD